MPNGRNKEIWKPIKGYEGLYEISSFGRVKSCRRKDSLGRDRGGIVLNPYTGNHGYKVANLWLNGVQKAFLVHKLVAMHFLNHKPNGFEFVVDHIDEDKLNNNVGNLRLVSNRFNSTRKSIGVSNYIGVSRLKSKWRANIRIDGDLVYLGTFDSEIDASRAYENKLKEISNGGK